MAADGKNVGVSSNNLDCDVEKSAVEAQPSQPSPPIKSPDKVEAKASVLRRQIVVVPRSERRGLLGSFSLIPEITNPRDYGNETKWAMTVIVSFAAVTSSTGSSIFYREYLCLCLSGSLCIDRTPAALTEVANDLHTTPTVANLSLAFYLLAMAFTPVWW